MLVMDRMPLPEFCSVTVFVVKGVPTFCVPKLRDAGLTEALGKLAPLIRATNESEVPPP
jgi:hypothetical protein